MKRSLCLLLTVCLMISLLSVMGLAEAGDEPTVFTLSGIDTDCRTGQLVVYTQSGTATGTGEKCTEALVDKEGKILSVGGYNNTVPEGGFILAGNGNKGKTVAALQVGDGLFYDKNSMTATLVPAGYNPFYESSVTVNGINTTRKQDTIILFNGQDGKTSTGTNAWGYEVVVDAEGFVIALGDNNSDIPAGGFVLSGHGAGKAALEAAAKGGMKVTLSSDRKTATFAFDKESAYKEYLLMQNLLFEELSANLSENRLIDGAKSEAILGEMQATLNALKGYLDKGNYVGYLKSVAEMEVLCVTAKQSITESIAAEGRGVWLRPALTKDRNKIFETVKSIWEAGFNQVYLEVQFDNTMIIPLPEGNLYSQNPALAGSDILKTYIEACHSYGIEIHAWMSVFRVGYEGTSNTKLSVGMKKPEWRQISKNGVDYVANAYGDAFFVNPALPEVREFLLETYRYILENYDLDGFQLDYIRYPNKADGEEFGYDDYTVKLYKDKYGKDPKTFTSGSADYTQWVQFRADFVTEFVRSVKELIDEIRPDVYLGAAVAPGYANSLVNMNQDSVTWLKEGLIDIVFPMAYGTTDAVLRYIEETVAAAGKDVLIYAGVSDQGAEVFADQILATRHSGADGVAFFSWNVYDNRYDSIDDWLFADTALSPTYNGKPAMLALLKQILKRSEDYENALGQALTEKVQGALEALEADTLSSCKQTVAEALDAVKEKVSQGLFPEAYLEDLSMAYRILENQKDDAKEAYRTEHPLPDSLIPEDPEGDTSAPGEESSEESVEESTAESMAESQEEVILTPVENAFRIVSMVLLFGGLALFPVYYVLNNRRRKIIRSFDEPKEPTEELDPAENEPKE